MTLHSRRVAQESPSPTEVTEHIVRACLEANAKDIAVLNISESSDIADYFIVASGRSDRQVQGIGNRVLHTTKSAGVQPEAVEGFDTGHWVLLDYGEVILHVFYEPLREYYDLEHLWSKAEEVDVDPKRILDAA